MKNAIVILTALTLFFLQTSNAQNMRIIGGSDTNVEEVPYQAYLSGCECGGIIINQSFVLTAAHCVLNKTESDITIIVGLTDLDDVDKMDLEIQKFSVKSILVHANYDFGSNPSDYDIALLEINGKFQYSDKVAPIEIITNETSSAEKVGNYSTISGWGETGVRPKTRHLQSAEVPIISKAEAAALYLEEGLQGIELTDRMLFTSTSAGIGTCNGDSGGPLTYSLNGSNILIGIVSGGGGQVNCATAPNIFTKLSELNSWVFSNAWNGSLTGASFACQGTNHTYSLSGFPDYLYALHWEKSNNLVIVDQNSSEFTVRGNANSGSGWVRAVLNDGSSVTKIIGVGLSDVSQIKILNSQENFNLNVMCWNEVVVEGVDSYGSIEWIVPSSNVKTLNESNRLLIQPTGIGNVSIGVKLLNDCGVSETVYQEFSLKKSICSGLIDFLK